MGALRHEAEGLEELNGTLSGGASDLGHASDSEVIPHGLAVSQATSNGIVPGDLVSAVSKVLLVFDLEADRLECIAGVLDGAHLGDAVADFDTVGNSLVLGVGGIPGISHAPLIDTELCRGKTKEGANRGMRSAKRVR